MPFTYLNTDGTRVGDSGRTVNPLQTPEVTFNNMGWTFVNNDSATPAVGDIVRSSGQNFGAVLAQADSAAHLKGILGVWDSSPAPGRSGAIKNNDTVEVNCTETVDPGDTLYLSAVTAGKATKTAPAIPVSIGNVLSVRVLDGVTKATVFWDLAKEELTTAQVEAAAALATSPVGPPSTAAASAEGDSGNLDGSYYYRVTFVTADGETEGGPPSDVLVVSNKAVSLSNIPVSTNARVTSRKIYRSPGTQPGNVYVASGDSPLTKLLATISDNVTTTYEDDTADGDLGAYLSGRNTTGGAVSIRGSNGLEISDDVTFLGSGAGGAALGSNRYTAIGKNAGAQSTLSFGCTFVGEEAGLKNGTLGGGDDNTFVGNRAGKENTSGLDNTFIGQSTGENNTSGTANTFVAEESGRFNTTGSENFFGGQSAGAYNGSGDRNTYVGMRAGGRTATSGCNDNVLVGRYTGDKIQTSGNTVVGSQGAIATTTGEKNTLVGFAAMYGNITGSRNVRLGHPGTVESATDLNDSIGIGYGAKPSASGQVVLGDTSVNDFTFAGAGSIHRIVANDFDPSVTGLAARLMAVATTLDGTKAWQKYGTADTNWDRVDEVTGTATMSSGPGSTLDITIAIPADRGCVFDAYLLGETAWTNLRLSGSDATVVKGLALRDVSIVGLVAVQVGVGTTSTTTATRSRVKIYPSINSRRLVVVDRANGRTENDEGGSWILINSGAETSIGISASGDYINDGTIITARVTNRL